MLEQHLEESKKKTENDRESQPLLINESVEIPVDELAMHHAVFVKIYDAFRKPPAEIEPDPTLYKIKYGVSLLLSFIQIFIYLFRFVMSKEFVKTLFQVPLLNAVPLIWVDNIARVLGATFYLSGVIVSIRSTRKALIPICLSPNWGDAFKAFFSDFMRGKNYPRSALISSFANGSKALAGVATMVTDEFSRIPVAGPYFVAASPALSYISSVDAVICYFLFNVCDKALSVEKAYQSLKDDPAWHAFQDKYASLIGAKKRQGIMLGLSAATTSIMGVLYHTGAFSLNLPQLIFSLLVSAFALYCNYRRIITQVHLYNTLKGLHEKQICDQCEVVPPKEKTKWDRAMPYLGVHNAIGEYTVYTYSMLRTVQILLENSGEKQYANNSWVLLGLIVLSAWPSYQAGRQGFSIRVGGGLFPEKKPKQEDALAVARASIHSSRLV